MNIVEDSRLNHTVHVIPGVLDFKSTALLKAFFGRPEVIPQPRAPTTHTLTHCLSLSARHSPFLRCNYDAFSSYFP
jgi:hypothetical protein